MKKCAVVLSMIAGILVLASGCEDDASLGHVRFRNDSAGRTVKAVWDGGTAATLAPGQQSEYRSVNPGTHTFQWIDAANNRPLTSMSWPNIVAGEYLTYPYSD